MILLCCNKIVWTKAQPCVVVERTSDDCILQAIDCVMTSLAYGWQLLAKIRCQRWSVNAAGHPMSMSILQRENFPMQLLVCSGNFLWRVATSNDGSKLKMEGSSNWQLFVVHFILFYFILFYFIFVFKEDCVKCNDASPCSTACSFVAYFGQSNALLYPSEKQQSLFSHTP
jgi:hypothetical protein